MIRGYVRVRMINSKTQTTERNSRIKGVKIQASHIM